MRLPCSLLCAQVASHRLSGQAHYDFGMRNLKSILLIAAQLRANLQVRRWAAAMTHHGGGGGWADFSEYLAACLR